MRLTISGDSHGKYIVVVLEGFPAGFRVNEQKVARDLERRRNCFGRGQRMKLEADEFEVVSGVWKGVTTGAPITILVQNKAGNPVKEVRSVPRPGHVDYAAWMRYRLPDLNVYVERASARWTVGLVAVGSLLKDFLEQFGIRIVGFVTALGRVELREVPTDFDELVRRRDESPVLCPDPKATEEMVREVEEARNRGDTLGGKVRVIARNVPAGLGGYSNFFEKLDSKIGAMFLAIPAVKGILIGEEELSYGLSYLDEFCVEDGRVRRKTNRLGGIEGGISNGEDIVVNVFVKPIPTTGTPLQSVDLRTLEPAESPYVRSDVTAVPPASVVCEAALAVVLADALLERYGNDNFEDLRRRFQDEGVPRWDDGFWEEHGG